MNEYLKSKSAKYRVEVMYRRSVSAVPESKRLVEVSKRSDLDDEFGTELGDICPDVLFTCLTDTDGETYWAKKWTGGREALEEPTRLIEDALAKLGRNDLCLSTDYDPKFGLIYPFQQTLFQGFVVHRWGSHLYFDQNECETIDRFGQTIIKARGLPNIAVCELTDFQVVKTDRGFVFLDFEPWPKFVEGLPDAF